MEDESTEAELLATLLRSFNRLGSMPAAVAACEREHGRPLRVRPGFLLEAESTALAIQEAADTMHALTCPSGSRQA